MNKEQVFSNARIVLADEVIQGSICLRDGKITAVDSGNSSLPQAQDLEGDHLVPGLVELHTDHMEKHFSPRPGVAWPAIPALLAHDAAVACAGITTVLNAVATGSVVEAAVRTERFHDMIDSLHQASAAGATRAEHLLHVRCELTYEPTLDLFESMINDPLLRMVSVMDHAPGQRQFVNLEKYQEYYKGKYKMNDEELDELTRRQLDISQRLGPEFRRKITATCRERNIALASHDDATEAHVNEAVADGMRIAEFPTTREAARVSRERGLHVMMGAPNAVRGFSHSGNVSARELAAEGLMDTLSSDYVPASLLHSAFILEETIDNISLPQAIAMVTRNPADAAGLNDRGEIAVGKRADLVQVRQLEHAPHIRQVWREGRRVA
ncbi:MAG: alpha-D-ribose 1-methylphosphonate 5-triphosphate diphosphatase [Gammaproteobacteria bacterium]